MHVRFSSLQTKVLQMSARALVNSVDGEIIEQIVAKGAMKRLIVSLHNQLRADVKPPATDMEKMVRFSADSDIQQQFK